MPNQEYIEDEIDLRDYIKVMLRRKKVILAVFFICVITATIISFLVPRVYESSSIIQIGKINELLMKKEEAREILLTQDFLKPIIKKLNLDIEADKLKKNINVENIKNTNFLKINVQYPCAKMAAKINAAIANSFISKGQAIYQRRVSLINDRLKEIEREIKSTEEAMRKVQNLIIKLSKSNAPQEEKSLGIIILQTTLSNYERQLTLLRNKKNNIEVLLAKSKDFKIVEKAITSRYPIKPKKKLNVAIASVLGLMLGVFIAFFQEFWEKGKEEKNTP